MVAGPKPKKDTKQQHFIAKYGTWIVLAIIVLIAVFLRFYQLDQLPPGLHPDEAANGQDIFRIFSGDIRPLYATNGPRESLFFFLQGFFVWLLGNTILALRIAPALIGVMAVIAVYYWGTDWFGRRVGLLAAFFMAVNPWVIIISRDGFRASMTPLMVALVAYFGGRAIKTKQMHYFIGAGIFLGLGAYTYTAYQLMVAAVVGLLGYIALFRRQWIKDNKKNFAAAIIAFLIVIAPLGVYVVRHSDAAGRAGGTSFLNKNLNKGKPLETLADSVQKTLLQYNFKGDDNPRHNIPNEPYLNTFVGIMFVLGLLVSLFAIYHSRYLALLFIFGAMMLPAALTAEGLPHGLRSIGSAPGVMILAAVGLSYFIGRWYTIFPINSVARNIGLSFVILLLGATFYQGCRAYFVAWAGSPDTYEAYADDNAEISKLFNTTIRGSNQPKTYMVVDGYSIRTIDYLTRVKSDYKYNIDSGFGLDRGSGWQRLEWEAVKSVPLTDQPTIFIVSKNYNSEAVLATLKAKYPASKLTTITSPSFPERTLFYQVDINR